MNSKYFGNALDLFKFDLLTHLATVDSLDILYVGMITEPQPKELDPKYLTYEIGDKNKKLKEFLEKRFDRNSTAEVNEITDYFKTVNIQFNMFADNEVTSDYFQDKIREPYFNSVANRITTLKKDNMIYFDPDVGSDIGVKRRFRSNKELYIKGEDLVKIKAQLRGTDFIGYFQHLGNTHYSVDKRVKDIKDFFGEWALMVGYARIQASIVLLLNNKKQYEDKREQIKQYFKNYEDLEHKEKIVIE
jgi:hypothetical protein